MRGGRARSSGSSAVPGDEPFFKMLLDELPVAVFVADRAGRPCYANRASVELLGKGVEPQARAEDLAEVYQLFRGHTDDPYPAAALPVVRALAGEGAIVDDIEIARPEGRVPLQVWSAPLRRDGEVHYGVAAFVDIRDRRRADRERNLLVELTRAVGEARDLEAALRVILRHVTDTTGWSYAEAWLHDGSGLTLSPAWHAASDVGAAFREASVAHGPRADRGVLAGAVAARSYVWVADVADRPDFPRRGIATELGLHAALAVPILAAGEVSGVLLFLADHPRPENPLLAASVLATAAQLEGMIERKRADEALARLNAELEQRVVERTAELREAVKELEAFSYSVSHDLRAPLRAVTGFAQILLDDYGDAMPPEARRYARLVTDNGRRMGLLIDDLLAFARAGRVELGRRTVDILPLVHRAWEALSAERAGRDIDLRIQPVPHCQGDPAMVERILVNLLGNAVKFTRPRDRAVITVGRHAAAEQPGEIVYFVADNGVGFDMRYADKLFGVFQRLHRPDDFEGTGVGLALVHRVVARHGGRIWAEAEPEHGATFYFSLPPAGIAS